MLPFISSKGEDPAVHSEKPLPLVTFSYAILQEYSGGVSGRMGWGHSLAG